MKSHIFICFSDFRKYFASCEMGTFLYLVREINFDFFPITIKMPLFLTLYIEAGGLCRYHFGKKKKKNKLAQFIWDILKTISLFISAIFFNPIPWLEAGMFSNKHKYFCQVYN